MRKKYKYSNGYKVCYREKDSKVYTRYFLTYTYRQAKYVRRSYMLYPPCARLDNLTWKIIPIKDSEIRDGIWIEDPF